MSRSPGSVFSNIFFFFECSVWVAIFLTGCHENSDPENSDLRPQTPKTQTPKAQTPKTQTPRNWGKKKNSSRLLSPELLYRHAVFKGNSPASKWDVQLLRLIAVASIKQWKSNIHFVWFIAVALGKQWKTKARFKTAADRHCFSDLFPTRKLRPRKLRPRKLRPRKLRPRKLRPRKLRPLEILKKRFKLVSVLITLMVLRS